MHGRIHEAALAASLLVILEDCTGPLACYDAALAGWAIDALRAPCAEKES